MAVWRRIGQVGEGGTATQCRQGCTQCRRPLSRYRNNGSSMRFNKCPKRRPQDPFSGHVEGGMQGSGGRVPVLSVVKSGGWGTLSADLEQHPVEACAVATNTPQLQDQFQGVIRERRGAGSELGASRGWPWRMQYQSGGPRGGPPPLPPSSAQPLHCCD